jgi:hypothetical protein
MVAPILEGMSLTQLTSDMVAPILEGMSLTQLTSDMVAPILEGMSRLLSVRCQAFIITNVSSNPTNMSGIFRRKWLFDLTHLNKKDYFTIQLLY